MCVHVRGSQRALNWSGGVVFSFLRRKALEVIVFLLTSVAATIALVLVAGEGGWWVDEVRESDEVGVSHGYVICCVWVLEVLELTTAQNPEAVAGLGSWGRGRR